VTNSGYQTTSNIEIHDCYDQPPRNAEDEIGYPGLFPFTRGIYPTMYRGRLWSMRQYAGFGSAAASNARYRYLMGQGQSALSVAFDLPTQMGYDSDHPLARGEVGKAGVAIDSLADMRALLANIPLDQVSVSMTINSTAAILLAMVVAVADETGIPRQQLRGTVQNDMLKEYAARGTYIFPPRPSMRLVTDIIAFTNREMPKWNPISISGYHIREAGATAVQEIAFTLANALAYVEAACQAGLSIDNFAPSLSFFFACHNEFIEEIAKFRAARRLWARLVRDRMGAKDPRSWQLRFHTQTGGSTLTAQQPNNNIVRVTLQALAAVLGGTQSLHTNSRDEALSLPTEQSATIALRTQQIVAHESGVANTVDPVAGSYVIEALTDELEARAIRLMDDIDRGGGAIAAIESGTIQSQIEEAAFRWQQDVESQRRIVVGVNAYDTEPPAQTPIQVIDPAEEERQIQAICAFRKRRDPPAISQALAELRARAAGTENLMSPIIVAIKAGATLGEISDSLRAVFGVYHSNS